MNLPKISAGSDHPKRCRSGQTEEDRLKSTEEVTALLSKSSLNEAQCYSCHKRWQKVNKSKSTSRRSLGKFKSSESHEKDSSSEACGT